MVKLPPGLGGMPNACRPPGVNACSTPGGEEHPPAGRLPVKCDVGPPPGLEDVDVWGLRRRSASLPSTGVCLLRHGLPSPPPGLVSSAGHGHGGVPPPSSLPWPAGLAVCSRKARAEWLIRGVFGKLKSSRGYALVSPPLAIPGGRGGCELRVHFVPGEAWAGSARGAKSKPGANAGLATGALRLKVEATAGACLPRSLHIWVGGVAQGVVFLDSSERVVHEVPLKNDWRKHIESGTQDLNICIAEVAEHA